MLKGAPPRRDEDGEASLVARAAWLHFSGGLTQGEVAKRLGIPGIKAHRLIARANRDGLVRVFVDADVAECLALETVLSQRYGLDFCQVAPDLGETAPMPFKALGLAGASFLKNEIERRDVDVIGFGHGRTLAAAIDAMPPVAADGRRFVSVFGGLTRRFAANPYDVIHRLAEKTGAEAFQIPLPVFANSAEDKRILLSQFGIVDVFELARAAPLIVAGIGDLTNAAFLLSSQMVAPEDIAQLRAVGAVGELLGHYFDADGNVVAQAFSERAISLGLDELRQTRVVALAGGAVKIAAIRALLCSELIDGLVTDETTARAIVEARGND